jgi:hypothetical protein
MFANQLGYSDINPFEVVRNVSAQCLEVRAMDAVIDPAFKPEWVVGGFAGQCVNQRQQQWIISSNPANRVIRIRLSKKGQWKNPDYGRFDVSEKPVKFYDYNF